ncbi:uncharacterized protein LOC101890935 [Musca domestica]|uniref:N-acetylglucosaminyl-phosphatidylinositol biosynthetic protein gpi1 n=1 Tax=Musca domestica TaxID=7370 RepID=A0A1I8MU06_MUSDO|nr:uncharacterized protein LOC101890935 [Musca domestica]
MSIKIFLPLELFYSKENCNIYGENKIGDNNCISYYITCAIADAKNNKGGSEVNRLQITQRFRHLGHIVNAKEAITLQRHQDVALSFVYDDETPNIYLNKLSIKPEKPGKINVFLFEERRILKLQDLREDLDAKVADECDDEDASATHNDDLHILYQLLNVKDTIVHDDTRGGPIEDFFAHDVKRCVFRGFEFSFNFMMWLLTVFLYQPPFKYIFQHTVLCEHYREWIKFRNCGKRRFNIAFDTFLGLCVMLILILYIDNPGNYLITSAHYIVNKFRLLLHSLKGSPIGLKLNVQLNNFLLECFGYHVELWDTFLNAIEPCIRQLFVPITILGSMGLSYQLALLSDIISVIGLHAHCFSIYAAVLYKVEIKGLQVLWKMFLGKRKNVLKNRVESHSYMNRQLYLGTVFFACLLFLFPTVLTYYVVFTTLRLGIGFVSYILKMIRRQILEFPMEMLLNWSVGRFYDSDSLQLEYVEHTPSPLLQQDMEMKMCVFKLKVNPSSLGRVLSCHSGVLQELVAKENNSIKNVSRKILTGTF